MKNLGKMNSIFEFFISKLGYMELFVKVYGKQFLTHFSGHFWQIEAKMKMKMKNYEKIGSVFEFSISKLGYVAVFMKIWKKTFWPIF